MIHNDKAMLLKDYRSGNNIYGQSFEASSGSRVGPMGAIADSQFRAYQHLENSSGSDPKGRRV